MSVGSQLKLARLECHLSQKDVSKRVHISRQAISRWENERGYPELDNLIALCAIYKKPIDFFLSTDPEFERQLATPPSTTQRDYQLIYREGQSIHLLLLIIAIVYLSSIMPPIGCFLPIITLRALKEKPVAHKLILKVIIMITVTSVIRSVWPFISPLLK